MTTKNILQLTALTVVIALVAFTVQRVRASAVAPEDTELFLPQLGEAINDVGMVTIQGQDETFTLERISGAWGMKEKGGYAVDGAKIRSYLITLAEAGRVEEKTSDPTRYERLGVQDVDAEGSNSTCVTVSSADGRELASLIVGKMRVSKGGEGSPGYYARTGGEAASWLVDGDLQVDSTSKGWLDQEILSIGRDSVVAMRIEHADGEVVACSKADPEAQYPELQDIPEGKEPTFEGVTARFTSALDRLRLDDVQKDGTVELPDPPQATATFWTKDGLKVTVGASEIESKLYCRFQAEYDENVPGAEPAPTDMPLPEGLEGLPEEAGGPGEEEGKSPEAVQKEAAEIQAKVAGWTYVLPVYKKTAFLSRMEELVRDIPEPTPPPTPDPAPGDGGDPGPGATDDATEGDATEDTTTEGAATVESETGDEEGGDEKTGGEGGGDEKAGGEGGGA